MSRLEQEALMVVPVNEFEVVENSLNALNERSALIHSQLIDRPDSCEIMYE